MEPIKTVVIKETPAVVQPFVINDIYVAEYSKWIPPAKLGNIPCHARFQIKEIGTENVFWEEHYSNLVTLNNIKSKVKHIKNNLTQYIK